MKKTQVTDKNTQKPRRHPKNPYLVEKTQLWQHWFLQYMMNHVRVTWCLTIALVVDGQYGVRSQLRGPQGAASWK